MYYYKEELINEIVPDKPDPTAAKVLQETLDGQFGEMRTMMQYSFQSANFFRLDQTRINEIFQGQTPSRNGGMLSVTLPPQGFPVPQLAEMPNEHSPGIADMHV